MSDRCEVCLDKVKTHVHHIVPRSLGGTDDPDNLAYLCFHCHAAIHTKRDFDLILEEFLRMDLKSRRYRRMKKIVERILEPFHRETIERFRWVIYLASSQEFSNTYCIKMSFDNYLHREWISMKRE